jgi:ABC-type arginine/histidine transport system permease subunit
MLLLWRQSMRRTLPSYSNEVVMMLHSTSLASAVPTMLDVTSAASRNTASAKRLPSAQQPPQT